MQKKSFTAWHHEPLPWIDMRRLGIAVGEELMQTFDSLDATVTALGIEALRDDPHFTMALDETALKCDSCDWWVPAEEIYDTEDGDHFCADCAA